jgi:hypothetical protein
MKHGRAQHFLYIIIFFYVHITKLTAQHLVMKYVGSEAWGEGGGGVLSFNPAA